ncbi:MAG: DUF309 domain-containing protein [Gemmataceae bacterium]
MTREPEAGGRYDPRYLAGIIFFNQGDYFEAHEVWEALWAASAAPVRKFYQGLIQAAVALLHLGNGNWNGARRLFCSARQYMAPYMPRYLGLDVEAFWGQMEKVFAQAEASTGSPEPPRIVLDPAPVQWPENPELYLEEDR